MKFSHFKSVFAYLGVRHYKCDYSFIPLAVPHCVSQVLSHQKASALNSVTERRFLIPNPLHLRLDAVNHTSGFHHAASETPENTGQTKTSLNGRSANKAVLFFFFFFQIIIILTVGWAAAAGSGMASLKTKGNPTALHRERKPCLHNSAKQRKTTMPYFNFYQYFM